MIETIFPSRLKAARLKAGLTQKEAAERISAASTTWASWEQGRAWPTVAQIDAIAAAVNADPADLIGVQAVEDQLAARFAALTDEERRAVDALLEVLKSGKKSG